MTEFPTHVLNHGGGVFTVTSINAAPQHLEPGTYTVNFDPRSGYSIEVLPDLQEPSYRVYGRRDTIIDKVIRTYDHSNRSLGVLFEGDKGIGKSSTTVELARQARDKFGIPVFLINNNFPGLSDFLGTLGECVIVFDEFEKNFPKMGDTNHQNQFLTLFDGTDSTKRLYIVTVNETHRLSEFFINRPGRFHYLISFDYPDADAVHEYISNETACASPKQISEAAIFAYQARLNYDHLRAIVTELNIAGPDASIGDIVSDLNIRDTDTRYYDVVVWFEDGTSASINRFDDLELYQDTWCDISIVPERLENAPGSVYSHIKVQFNPQDTRLDRQTGKIVVDEENLTSSFFCRDLGVPRKDREPAAEAWERELLGDAATLPDDNGVEVVLDENTEGQLSKFRVKRVEFTPSKNDHARFFG